VGEPKILITGTGRAGSTLLVRVLDELGLDTGLTEGKLTPFLENTRAGLECHVDDPEAPRVVKSIPIGFRLRELLEAGTVELEHVIIPTRRLDIAAASRIRAAEYGRLPIRHGALTGTLRATQQQKVLARMQADMFRALDDFNVPYTILEFPRFATDAEYLHASLSFIAPGASVADFQVALGRHVRPDMIHEMPLSRAEVERMWFTTAWTRWVRYPIARIRRRLNPQAADARLREAVIAERRRQQLASTRDSAGGSSTGSS
jgi:hypothetical protein